MIRSPIKWFGGKSWLVEKIIGYIPQECDVVIEAFGGGAWLTLNLPQDRFKVVICNDINNMLINFWTCLRTCPNEIRELSEHQPDSETIYKMCEKYIDEHSDPIRTFDDGELSYVNPNLAACFFYVNTHSYSGIHTGFHGLNFSTPTQNQRAYLSKIDQFEEVWSRIKHVTFKNTDVIDLLKSADRENVFIYLDPPYFQGGEVYESIHGGHPWGEEDFFRLRERVWEMEHAKILISIDEGEYFLKDGWYLEEIEKTKKLRAEAKIGRETIITNYKPEKMDGNDDTAIDPFEF